MTIDEIEFNCTQQPSMSDDAAFTQLGLFIHGLSAGKPHEIVNANDAVLALHALTIHYSRLQNEIIARRMIDEDKFGKKWHEKGV
jgi:hypothetical protein